jgi:ligand-binding SRPBCC domain-containing protein
MTLIQNQVEITAPVEQVFNYYINSDNIKGSSPRDIVRESEIISGQKREEGSEIKVKGEYMGKEDEVILKVVDKVQNKKLFTRQTQGPFQRWESIQKFHSKGNNYTKVSHSINYKLPTTGNIENMLTGGQVENNIKNGIEQAAQAVKVRLESI